MKHVLVTQPVATFGDNDEQSIKRYVSEQNARILLCEEYPTSFSLFSVKTMLGDPNYVFSDHIAILLWEHGILSREPWLDLNGRQAILVIEEQKSLMWDYSWGPEPFETLDEPTLLAVGWDVRNCPGFYNVVIIEDEPEKVTEPPPPAEPEEDVYAADSDEFGLDDQLD